MPNQLIHEQSPYLLQHAHNPVDWQPWGEAAFARAKSENKPLIVSIGYSACHWCHVMEHESFEDAATAEFMNAHFINVKVDREEYPEVDDFYMTAVQAISGSGGWPLNVFVTPEKLPFYGGTYFPPIPAHGRPSWKQLMQRMVEVWQNKPEEIAQQAQQMLAYLQNAAKVSAKSELEEWIIDDTQKAAAIMLQQADKVNGGFGRAPKFPSTMSIQFLLEHYHFTRNEDALEHALLSLNKMIAGGLYDQIGGGFSRYSVDEIWLVPHFEKMLYDNAMLLNVLCDAFVLTGDKQYKDVIEQTIEFLWREMKQKDAGFYSALDADSEGVEGKYYTFSFEEFHAVLPDAPDYIAGYFGIEKWGNWEHTNILHRSKSLEQIAKQNSIRLKDLELEIEQAKRALFAARNSRIRPGTDDKILLSWNALLSTAISKASVALSHPQYAEDAAQHMDWMLQHFDLDNSPKHIWKAGFARITANLDDLANLVQSLIQLSMAVNEEKYLIKAIQLCVYVYQHFSIPDSPMFFFTSDLQHEVPLRKPELYDGVTPSSNAVMAHNLHLLGMLSERPDWIAQSESMLSEMKGQALRYPTSFGFWNIIGQRIAQGYKTIVVSGEKTDEVLVELQKKFLPNCYYFFEKKENFVTMPFGKQFKKETQIFICTKNSCLPTLTKLPENPDFAIL
jgi:uncharacterized protein YyaL (SSP411 family)